MRAIFCLLFGAVAGGAVVLVVWPIVSRKIDRAFEEGSRRLLSEARPALEREISQQLDRNLPPLVERSMQSTLTRYGLTPETGRRIASVLDRAERIGLLGVRSAG